MGPSIGGARLRSSRSSGVGPALGLDSVCSFGGGPVGGFGVSRDLEETIGAGLNAAPEDDGALILRIGAL